MLHHHPIQPRIQIGKEQKVQLLEKFEDLKSMFEYQLPFFFRHGHSLSSHANYFVDKSHCFLASIWTPGIL